MLKRRLVALLREPLVHFVVLGALVFALSPKADEDDAQTIRVTAAIRDRVAAETAARTGRTPTEDELARLLDAWIEEEILYREGIALGLHRDDPVIRRRIVQAVRFIEQSGEPIAEPTAAELEAFVAEHAERYAGVPRYDFVQIVVPHAEDPDGDRARAWLARLQAGADPATLDVRVATSRRYTLDNAAGTFGREVAEALRDATPGEWSLVQMPTARALLRVDEARTAEPPTLDQIRNRVQLDYVNAQRDAIVQRAITSMRARYRVVHEP